MTVAALALWAAGFLLVFAVGYGLGRRHGLRQGFALGAAYAPLDLRQRSLERGACVLCAIDTTAGGSYNHNQTSRAELSRAELS